MTLLDTSIVIDQLRKGETHPGNISILTIIELLRGIPSEKRRALKENLEELYNVQQISNEVVLEYCRIYTELKESGELIQDADILIAATAIASEDELSSKDSDFKRLTKNGLVLA
jgi:tRNA(fMet)-specific endonuclease VapC